MSGYWLSFWLTALRVQWMSQTLPYHTKAKLQSANSERLNHCRSNRRKSAGGDVVSLMHKHTHTHKHAHTNQSLCASPIMHYIKLRFLLTNGTRVHLLNIKTLNLHAVASQS